MTQEEISRKKKLREDQYIQNFEEQDRPVLVIKSKEEFKNLSTSMDKNKSDNYVKMTDNTQLVGDVPNQILSQSQFIRRDTQIHGAPARDQEAEDDRLHYYKVEGVEFLPEGFLELDPLLFHDEYQFDNEIQKELFNNEQRKIKAKRRKQYEVRNQNKMRDVTLFIADPKQEKILEFLDKWYFKKRRRMNDEELNILGKEFAVDPQTMQKLQNDYLEHRQKVNTNDLHQFLLANDRERKGQVNIPPSLQKYFVKLNNPYKNVQSRVYDQKEIYNPYKMNEWDNKMKSQNLQKSKSKKKAHKNGRFVDRIFKDMEAKQQENGTIEMEKKSTIVSVNQSQIIRTQEGSQNGGGEQLQSYFDQEVNKILTKINNFSGNLNKSHDVSYNGPVKQDNGTVDEITINELMQEVMKNNEDQQPKKPMQKLKAKSKRAQAKINSNKNRLKKEKSPITKKAKNIKNSKSKTPQKDQNKIKEESEKIRHKSTIKGQIDENQSHSQTFVKQSIKIESTPKDQEVFAKQTLTSKRNSRQQKKKSFEKPKSKTIVNRQKSNGVQKRNKTLGNQPDQLDIKKDRVSLIFKNHEGDTVIIQKLGVIMIGNDYYFQTIEEVIPQNGLEPRIELITKNELGVVTNRKILEMERLGKFYRNKVVFEPEKFSNQVQNKVIVENDKGQIVSIQQIAEKVPLKLNQLFPQRQTQGRYSSFQGKNRSKTTHVLQPINIGNEYYQQVVNETIEDEFGTKKLDIITHDKDGKVLLRETLLGQWADKYTTEIIKDILNENGDREVKIATLDKNGDLVTSHVFVEQLGEKLDKEMIDEFQKGRVTTFKQRGKKIRSYTMGPVLLEDTFYRQKLYEIQNQNGKKIKLVTENDKGVVIGEDFIDEDEIAQNYATIIDEILTNNGRQEATLLTKNNKGETINIRKVYPRSKTDIGLRNFQSFMKKANGRETFVDSRGKGTKQIYLRPTFLGEVFYQQVVEEVVDGNNKQTKILTKNCNGEVIASDTLNIDIRNEDLQTKLAEIEGDETKIKVLTLDNKGNVLNEQEIEKALKEEINEDYIDKFNKKAKGLNLLRQSYEGGGNHVICWTMEPVQFQDKYYQQILLEIKDQFSEKDLLLVLRNQKGEVIQVKEGNFQVDISEELIQKLSNDGNLKLYNDYGELISEVQIVDENVSKRKYTCFYKPTEKKFRHTMKLNQRGLDHYEQVVEEIIQGNQLQVVAYNIDDKGKKQEIRINQENIGESYYSRVGGTWVDQKGTKKTLVEIINHKQKVIGSFEVEDKSYQVRTLLDGEKIEKIGLGEQSSKKTDEGLVVLKKLRPTQVGVKTYDCYLEEVMSPDGGRRLTLIMKDEDQNEVERQDLDNRLMAKDYESFLLNRLDELGNRQSWIEFRNSKRQLMFKKELPQKELQYNEEKYDKVEALYDHQNHRAGTIYTQKKRDSVIKTYKMRPTQLGAQFYQHTIEEVLVDGVPKKCTYILRDEQGEILEEKELDIQKSSDLYYTDIKEELIKDGQERVILLNVKNYYDEVLHEIELRGQLVEDVDPEEVITNVIEEEIDEKGQRKVSIYQGRNSKLSFKFDAIKEAESKYEQDSALDSKEKLGQFEDLLKKYGEESDERRLSFNEKKIQNRPKAHTFNPLLQNLKSQNQSNLNQHESLFQEIEQSQNNVENVYDDEELKRRVSSILNKEKDKLIDDIMFQMNKEELKFPYNTLDEFKEFCRVYLPTDAEYKESVLLISLFYYYMKKKNMKINQII